MCYGICASSECAFRAHDVMRPVNLKHFFGTDSTVMFGRGSLYLFAKKKKKKKLVAIDTTFCRRGPSVNSTRPRKQLLQSMS